MKSFADSPFVEECYSGSFRSCRWLDGDGPDEGGAFMRDRDSHDILGALQLLYPGSAGADPERLLSRLHRMYARNKMVERLMASISSEGVLPADKTYTTVSDPQS